MTNYEDTKSTKEHEGGGPVGGRYRSQAAKSRAKELSAQIVGAAIEVHRCLGPGLLESVYELCLSQELTLRGIEHRRQVGLPVSYKGVHLEAGIE